MATTQLVNPGFEPFMILSVDIWEIIKYDLSISPLTLTLQMWLLESPLKY
jgi:hypothetical protein